MDDRLPMPVWNHQVFLSFRGPDTRDGFIRRFDEQLGERGIVASLDREEIEYGDRIDDKVAEAIERSDICIPVFSEDFATSPACLMEVVQMVESNKTILPIFYGVEPSVVRHQLGTYERSFAEHERKNRYPELIKMWKAALEKISHEEGPVIKNDFSGDESEAIQRVVKEICTRLSGFPLNVAKHPVGINSHVIKLKSRINLNSNDDILMLGVWGPGGIGKTAIVKAIYNDIFTQFEGSSFLAHVRENSKGLRGLVSLQEKLLNDVLLPQQRIEVPDVDTGIELIQHKLHCKKVLLILDDVDNLQQLNALAQKGKFFGDGSRIITTTRDKQLLTFHGIDENHVYEVKLLDDGEALELFSKHASLPQQKFESRTDLVDRVLSYAHGLPLALEVLGSLLYGRRESEWEDMLQKISVDPNRDINDKLKISYDGLEANEKEIFLHIACFFKGWKTEYTKKVLNSCGLEAERGLEILIEKSLIKTESGIIQMHNLIQLMGMDIVRQECHDDPGRRSRLWLYDDVLHVLSSNMEYCDVKAIVLKPPELKEICIGANAFRKMKMLRLLIVRNVHNSFQSPIGLPDEISWFEWPGWAPWIPDFSSGAKKLVGPDMSKCSITIAPEQFMTSVAAIEHVIGIDNRVKDVIKLLDMEDDEVGVRIVGIHGTDGIGKTTIAKAVYDRLSSYFDRCSFLAEIGETARETTQNGGGIEFLQAKLIRDILEQDCDVASFEEGIQFFLDVFRNVKALIVLDDVEDQSHLHQLVGEQLDWFGPGSRMIVTSENGEILQTYVSRHQARSYEVNEMDGDRALELFCKHASTTHSSIPDYLETGKRIIEATRHVPFAIEVIGSFLRGKTIEDWWKIEGLIKPQEEKCQERLKHCMEILKICYNALNENHKQMFQDLPWFAIAEDSRIASYMWPSRDSFLPHHVLMPLAKIGQDNMLRMHKLAKRLSKTMDQEESKYRVKRIRLSIHDTDLKMINRKEVAENVEVLCFDKKDGSPPTLTETNFKSVPNVRFLKLDHASVTGNFASVFPKLRWLRWQGCPEEFKAIEFNLPELVILDLSWSKVTKVWEGWSEIKMEQLKVLNLTGCNDLLTSPTFSSLPNLEILILERCSRLVHLDPSVGVLKKLLCLNLKSCTELNMLPAELGGLNTLKELLIDDTSVRDIPWGSDSKKLEHMTSLSILSVDNSKLSKLPSGIGELVKLRRLSLRNCHWIREVPESIGRLGGSLEELDISGTGISKLPDSFGDLWKLRVLKMDDCFISKFPSFIRCLDSLEEIHASSCRNLEGEIPGDIGKLKNLRILRLQDSAISSLPPEIKHLSKLETLDLLHCDMLQELPALPSGLVDIHLTPKLKDKLIDSSMAIGEIFLSSLLQVLFEKLASLGLEFSERERVQPFFGIIIDLLNKWKKMLDAINAVLDDAEDKQVGDKGPVKLWLDDFRDLAYDMEDLLDELAMEAAQAKSEAEYNTSRGLAKLGFSSLSQHESSISNPTLRSFMYETEVQKINDRIEGIITRKAHLSLIENAMGRFDYTYKRLPSTSQPEPWFFGREKEEVEILKILTSEAENGDTTLSIVPIVGMGGVGKTALAHRLYNDARMSSCFERRAWICVSDVFDVLEITKAILQSIIGFNSQGEDLNMLQEKLKSSLSKEKLLVVLDNVWNENYEDWSTLLKPFKAGTKGSKIMITTRNRNAISIIGASSYPLEGLSLDDCTSLLAFHAFGAANFEMRPDLKKLGKKIAEKCKGSPLATRVLGSLLRDKANPDQWKAILDSKMWDLPAEECDEVLRVLKMSYVHLPSYLKRCFAYCAVFPKDYEIERDELVHLWIAGGFLDGQGAKENILKLGHTHFDELVSRSFLQQSSVYIAKFSMHDLLNDLAKSIAGETCFTSGKSQLASNEDYASLEKVRYASFISSFCVTSKWMRAYHRMKALKCLILMHDGYNKIQISNKVLRELLTELKYLRVLSLCGCSIVEIPSCIGDLKHLRYLNFSYTNIERLPESIIVLCKLQVLILRGCQKLSMLPPGITKMVSLQFLDVRDTGSLKEMPSGIGNLKNLIILSKFVVGLEKGSQLKELKDLPYLQGELFISKLQKVEEVKDAVDANLFGKQGLSKLSFCWDEDFGNPRNEKGESQVLYYLRPYIDLESLTISYYGGAIFSSWLECPSYSKIVSLCLRGCPNVTSLPSLGQLPSLRELTLEGLHTVRMIGSEFYGSKRPFSSLTTLKFREMRAWEDWSHYACVGEEEVPLRYLEHLVIWGCRSLVGTLPCQLDCLIKLEIHSCPHLHNSTSEICLPSLCELYLEDCDEKILKSLVNLTSLIILKVKNVMELVCFDSGFMSYLFKLKELHIEQCDKLAYLWRDGIKTRNLTCLQKLAIESCAGFKYFVVEGEIEMPYNLESMELKDCMSLENLPSNVHTLKNLQIENCPNIKEPNIPYDDRGSVKSMSRLESLNISGCGSLKSFLFADDQLAALKELQLSGCQGVESLEEITGGSLESLVIIDCGYLESLPQSLHTLSHLTRLEILKCPALDVEDFPPLPITLSSFKLESCPGVTCLPNQWHHLTSLRSIDILDCPLINCLPNEGFPLNLWRLSILGCENLKQPVREWGLFSLTSLKILSIDFVVRGEGAKAWFPSDEEGKEDAWSLLFPSSLTTLFLIEMYNVERLSSGLCNHLSSLQALWIVKCPELRYFPEDGLPPSLQELRIRECEILKDRCSKPTGDYWPLIQEIPIIEIDWHRIQ